MLPSIIKLNIVNITVNNIRKYKTKGYIIKYYHRQDLEA